MNDFSKEELETIRTSNNIASQMYGWTLKRQSLLYKLNIMIDNYCEQETLNDYDMFLPKVGAILTDTKASDSDKLGLIKQAYIKTVWPEKVENNNDH